ncbi:amino acid ABC transporter permease [Acidisphaera sp. L21]|uniref:amino acid ABC transporter permease n=1 Tax=Acidisphaera sp. L21 TaxID=1641851 RepID=UPI00131C7F87|nr:amino acid ABC transporter permease [Acidisphaera sp. L21]
MSGAVVDPRLHAARAAPKRRMRLSWSDPKFRAIVWQVLVVGILAAIVAYLVHNTNKNLAARHIATGFAFLARTAGIPIGEHAIEYDPATSTYGDALIIGIINTLKVAIVGVVLTTIWGTLLGIARLSKNWLLSRAAYLYVEILRDIPLLLQLLFWYGLVQTLPSVRDAFAVLPGVFFSNRGIKVPLFDWEPAHSWALAAFLVGLIGVIAWSSVASKRQAETGVRPKTWPVALGLLVAFPLFVWAVLGAPFQLDMPIKGGFNFRGGGTISPEYCALTLGLVVYTAAYIAEIVRSGIQAVPQGQWEAAGALGLRPGAVLRQIVLPQALRVVIPPMTSQFLNLTKNSSLAVAIGYQDVVSIDQTTLNQTGQAIEGIALLMAVFLVISLSISLFMNWYNARIALVER